MKKILSILTCLILVMCVGFIACGEPEPTPQPEHTHEYNKEVATEQYLLSKATCENKAVYYYSCTCGEKGAKTFEYGDVLTHNYGEWVSNGNGTHTKTCANDSTHTITENCSGGTATCGKKAECDTCKGEYGNLADHTYVWMFTETHHYKQYTCGCTGEIVKEEHDYSELSCTICEYPFEPSEDVVYAKSAGGKSAEVVAYRGKGSVVRIASTYQGVPVKIIAQSAFIGSEIESIIIPDSVEKIGSGSFQDCKNLVSVYMGNGLTTIDGNAFWGCDNLTTVHMPAMVKLETGAFFKCLKLNNVVLPKTITQIGTWAFFTCESLTRVFYEGTSEEWDKVVIGSNNYEIINVTKYFYVENESDLPNDGGNYWHYVDGIPTVW